jgi:hypothetical protein
MARTALATVAIVDEGAVAAFTAANVDGHTIPGGGNTRLLVTNGSASPIDVTVQTAATTDGLAVTDQVVTIAAGATKAIGPFRPTTYDRASGAVDAGLVYVDFSAVASVTVLALEG